MEHKTARVAVFIGVSLSALAVLVLGAQDKYTVKVPNGLTFSEFKGHKDWQAVGPSQTDAAKRDQTYPCESRDDRRIQERCSRQW